MTAPPLEADGDIRPGSSPIDYLGRVAALAPLITASIEQIERERRLPQPLVDAMIEAGLFRLLVPRPLDGGEIDPVGFVRVIEAIARLDASTAWCLCQTAVCGMVAAFLAPEAAWEIFGRDPRAVLAWGSGPGGRAMPVEGGYRVTGTWPFASGGHHATWLGGHCLVLQPDGTPALAASGAPLVRTMLFPASQITMTDNWNVIGLKGTGSDTYSVKDVFVPAAHSLGRDDAADRRRHTPLYHLRTDNMFSSGFASLALGVARGMLEALIALAKEKSPRGLKQTMRESAVVQSDVGELEARLRATRHYLLGTLAEVWEAVERTDQLTIDHRMAIRLAASRTIHESRDVANACYHAAGATAKAVGRITRPWASFFWGSKPTRRFSRPAIGAVMFALPLYDDNPSTTIPFVTYTLIVACVFVFVWQIGLSPRQAHQVVLEYGMIPALLFGYAELPPQLHPVPAWATLFTSMFLHGPRQRTADDRRQRCDRRRPRRLSGAPSARQHRRFHLVFRVRPFHHRARRDRARALVPAAAHECALGRARRPRRRVLGAYRRLHRGRPARPVLPPPRHAPAATGAQRFLLGLAARPVGLITDHR